MSTIPEKDLPPGRHRVLREHLMREITNEMNEANEANETPPPVRPPLWRRPAFVAPALAGALSVAVVLGVTVTRDATGPSARPGIASSDRAPDTMSRQNPAELLERIARTAEKGRLSRVRDNQFVYSEVDNYHWKMDPGLRFPDDCAMTAEGHPYGVEQSWKSVDGQSEGLRREYADGKGSGDGEYTENTIARQLPGKTMPEYFRQVEELPTDPEGMYRWLYGLEPGERASGKRAADVKAYEKVATLLTSQLLPPKTAAALYRAAARIPGLFVVNDARDAAGRRGVAVAMKGASLSWTPDRVGARSELIFDEKTDRFLGESTVRISGPKSECDVLDTGDLVESVAVVDRGIVDETGQLP
ncbi:CU044_5270 family protein [Streptomyces sp. ActVer]|uniref:CU044_5270 family protein n=1 Tax=Streptomyces sp. ActVer TaxID=3014558 RepID=UPI0022B34576|nr:CU044_5270 family protein [Streptomyces sp. ActVer]MCZ4510402.1 CU044_5270 family protein [Streptomyces sp. ActVer]